MCTSLLTLHCHIFCCVLFTQRNQCVANSTHVVQLFCVLTRRGFCLLSLVQSLGDALFRLAAVSLCWLIKAQEVGAARAGLPCCPACLGTRVITSRAQCFVCVSEKSASFVDMTIAEFYYYLYLSLPVWDVHHRL